MLERVEVRVIENDLADNMREMRTWLDNRRLEPCAFRCVSNGQSVLIRVDFEEPGEASAFAQQFSGRMLATRLA